MRCIIDLMFRQVDGGSCFLHVPVLDWYLHQMVRGDRREAVASSWYEICVRYVVSKESRQFVEELGCRTRTESSYRYDTCGDDEGHMKVVYDLPQLLSRKRVS